MNDSLQQVICERQLLVCVGSGGVGKTSVAAATGLQAAREGRRVLVLTIDPARRLANALGLQALGNEAVRIALEEDCPGELWAMMLDTATTFDSLVDRLATDEESRRAIHENRIYNTISQAFSGSQEYMAGEALYDEVNKSLYDLVVLDTPPAKNALDFLDASDRLVRFLDPRILRWFLSPYEERHFLGRLLSGTSSVVFRLLGYVFGREFLGDLSEFLLHFKDMYGGFRERHEAVLGMLKDSATGFLVVCSPSEASVEVAAFFSEELRRRGLPHAATVVNQVLPCQGEVLDPNVLLGGMTADLQGEYEPGTAATMLARLGAAHRRLREHAALERALIAKVESTLPVEAGFLVEVPRIEGEVHDLQALGRVARHLVGGPAAKEMHQ